MTKEKISMDWVKLALVVLTVFITSFGMTCFVCGGMPNQLARMFIASFTGLTIIIGTLVIVCD